MSSGIGSSSGSSSMTKFRGLAKLGRRMFLFLNFSPISPATPPQVDTGHHLEQFVMAGLPSSNLELRRKDTVVHNLNNRIAIGVFDRGQSNAREEWEIIGNKA